MISNNARHKIVTWKYFPLIEVAFLYSIKYNIRAIIQIQPIMVIQYIFHPVFPASHMSIRYIGIYSIVFWWARNIRSNSILPVIAGGNILNLDRAKPTWNPITNCIIRANNVRIIKYVSMNKYINDKISYISVAYL